MQATIKHLAIVNVYGVRTAILPGMTPDTVVVYRTKGGIPQPAVNEPRSKWAKHIK